MLLSNKYKSAIFHGVIKQINDCLRLELGIDRKKQEKGEIFKEQEEIWM